MEEIVGLGICIIFSVFAYFMYQIARILRHFADLDYVKNIAEILTLKRLVKKKGIDLDTEMAKQDVWKKLASQKTFREKLQSEMKTEMFGKDGKSDK